jgi:hypothetical protein
MQARPNPTIAGKCRYLHRRSEWDYLGTRAGLSSTDAAFLKRRGQAGYSHLRWLSWAGLAPGLNQPDLRRGGRAVVCPEVIELRQRYVELPYHQKRAVRGWRMTTPMPPPGWRRAGLS